MHKQIKIDQYEVLVDEDVYERIKSWTLSINVKYKGTPYVYLMLPGEKNPIPLHRWIMDKEITGIVQVDHIDRNTLNNLRSNLRVCTYSENLYNQPPYQKKANCAFVSKYKGVSFHKLRNKWRAYITKDGNYINLLLHESEDMCAYAYNVAANRLAGQFAYLNNHGTLTPEQIDFVDRHVFRQLSKKNLIR